MEAAYAPLFVAATARVRGFARWRDRRGWPENDLLPAGADRRLSRRLPRSDPAWTAEHQCHPKSVPGEAEGGAAPGAGGGADLRPDRTRLRLAPREGPDGPPREGGAGPLPRPLRAQDRRGRDEEESSPGRRNSAARWGDQHAEVPVRRSVPR